MASNAQRRSARNTPKGSNVVGIQRKINSDYEILARDYGKLFSELWRNPTMKLVLGGVAVAAIAPFAIRWLDRNRVIPTYLIENFDGLKARVQDILPTRESDSV